MQSGLYIVGTPIGNLADLSPRARDTLRDVDLIVCEDTRVSGKLAAHFDIKTKRIAMHEHNESDMVDGLLEKIRGGAAIACISDSGMPAVSDPGFRLIRGARDAKVPVFVVPGPTAVISALVLSGFPTDRFTFCGFLPSSASARDKTLALDNRIRHTIIYYDAPQRVMDTIAALSKIMPERRVAIVREITKMFEETVIGYPSEIIDRVENQKPKTENPFKGEIVLVIEPAPEMKMTDSEIHDVVNDVVRGGGHAKTAAAELSARTGISKKEAYERILKSEKSE